jgi:exopolyphosphatase/guanosine-5'-triphosphate,3'-diphosphate pyrophosphatase
MIVASIDIGTNTVLLLIADVDPATKNIIPLYNEQNIPRIGEGLSQGSPFNKKKLDPLYEILGNYKKTSNEYKSQLVLAAATNPFRLASDSAEVAAAIKKKFNIDVKILNGEEEACYSYLGATGGIADEKKILVVDIGGGSTELIYGMGEEIIFNRSYQLGAVSSKEKYLLSDPPVKEEIAAFISQIENIFQDSDLSIIKPEKTIAIAGTPTTIAAIKSGLNKFDEDLIEGHTLTIEEMAGYVNVLSSFKSIEILRRYKSVVKGREDVLLAGTIILKKIMDIIGIPEVTVSTKGIRYGAITNFLINKCAPA